ncbi:hypothetical protein [Parvibaculum sp.]|uniref:hypothetical protein n=1 Tax=Parvibaculum sp. TaxID=2024848 RepID=UPI001D3DDE0D|nr:hypothetical protein [Parvibaculum sp.]MBX3490882.1 hypothetical protein [Parvibaculum sp.]
MNHQPRIFGASVRQSLYHVYAASGESIGMASAHRCLWEIGDSLSDIHGRREASAALYKVADAIAVGGAVETVWPLAPEPDMKHVADAAERVLATLKEVNAEFEKAAAPPPQRSPWTFLAGFADACARHWFGVAFIAFYAGMVIGRVI